MSNPTPDRTQELHKLFCLCLTLIVFTGIFSNAAVALPEDREQPIHITADQALRDEKEGFTVYTGNVEMNQGTLHISADTVTIFRIVEEADKIVATGSKATPASLQQQPEPDKGLVKASAGIIEYYKNEARVLLKENAKIDQEGSSVTGETIDYYINEQLVKADSNRSGEDSRVKVIIPAQAINSGEH